LLDDLRGLVEPQTRGDPQSPLLWTSKSLCDMGHKIGRTLVGELLHKLDYRLRANRKTREGSHHPDRDAQFHYITDRVKEALAAGEPAISVDTKKKELVGDFKNAGREWRPKGSPEEVRVHDWAHWNAPSSSPSLAETPLLLRARTHGRRIHHARHALDHQVPLYLEWFGIDTRGVDIVKLVRAIP